MNPNPPLQRKLRILIADDSHETRLTTRIMLSEIPNVEVVAIASNGKQSIEMADEQRPDIVILDVIMPEMDGLTAYKRILQNQPQTGCIMISGENDPSTIKTAELIGARAFLIKPFTVNELEAAINRINEHLMKTRTSVKPPNTAELNNQGYLEQAATLYMKEGRTDNQAVQVFESLAKDPQCNKRWLETLAMIYAIRGDWGKLKLLAGRLEQYKENPKK